MRFGLQLLCFKNELLSTVIFYWHVFSQYAGYKRLACSIKGKRCSKAITKYLLISIHKAHSIINHETLGGTLLVYLKKIQWLRCFIIQQKHKYIIDKLIAGYIQRVMMV